MTHSNLARRALLSAQADAISKVNEALQPMGKKMWRVTETDGLRLTRLAAWSERYSVSIGYIIVAVLAGLSKAVERRTGRKTKSGLGVSIPVLTGEVAKSILLEHIAEDFPGSENVHALAEDRRNAMLLLLDEDSIGGRPKNPLAYRKSDDFTKAYVAAIHRRMHSREIAEEQIAAMPFRDNPFR